MAVSKFGVLITLTFCTALVAAAFLNLLPVEVAYLYIAISTITFAMYAFDKSAARKGKWRVPETRLHLLSLLGGWPGAYLAQRRLRHKSAKVSFKRVYWATATLNSFAFIWLFSEQGQHFINAILG
jgi:uncharacterized membrane protein YsdA (DUF1294 family)